MMTTAISKERASLALLLAGRDAVFWEGKSQSCVVFLYVFSDSNYNNPIVAGAVFRAEMSQRVGRTDTLNRVSVVN